MELVVGMARNCNRSRLLWMLELTMAATLSSKNPAIVVQQPQKVANFHLIL